MLYESVSKSVAQYRRQRKNKQTYEQKLVFRWKFVVIGLGVVLLILIGICSELVRTIGQIRDVPINTSFLATLLPQSQFFKSELSTLRHLVSGLHQTPDIQFTKSTLLFSGSQSPGSSIAQLIQSHPDLLFLFRVSTPTDPAPHSFALYLHPPAPALTPANITDYRDQLFSTMISLDNGYSLVLDTIDSCYVYSYGNIGTEAVLTLLEMLVMGDGVGYGELGYELRHWGCFGRGETEARAAVGRVVGYEPVPGGMELRLERLEIHALE